METSIVYEPVSKEDTELVFPPRCLGCTRHCIHNGLVMAKWKAGQIEDRKLNACHTFLIPPVISRGEKFLHVIRETLRRNKNAV